MLFPEPGITTGGPGRLDDEAEEDILEGDGKRRNLGHVLNA